MNHRLEQAIDQFRNQAARYRKSRRYYAGEQDLQFASEKFASTFGNLFREFALNLCPAIVDAVRDKLKIESFAAAGVSSPHVSKGSSQPVEAEANTGLVIDRIWRSNRMAIRSGEVHKEALKNGDAYVIVWPGADGRVQIVPQSAETCTVHYDEDEPGRIAWAAKQWRDVDKRTRLNLFFPDRIERYVSKPDHGGHLPDARSFTNLGFGNSDFGPDRSDAIRNQQSTIPNPHGFVPVFHFANNADIGAFGRSELEDAMAVQDGLNKSVLDMLVAMEVCSFRQGWIAGIEVRTDEETGKEIQPFKTSMDNVWMTENTDARFGEFGASDLEQFLKVKDGFRIDMASVTGTPLYYLMPQIRGFPSGESLRKAETRFLAKVRDRQEQFGPVWEDVMSFALRLAGHANVSLSTRWEDASPTNERDVLENLRLKRDLGVPPEQILREAGY